MSGATTAVRQSGGNLVQLRDLSGMICGESKDRVAWWIISKYIEGEVAIRLGLNRDGMSSIAGGGGTTLFVSKRLLRCCTSGGNGTFIEYKNHKQINSTGRGAGVSGSCSAIAAFETSLFARKVPRQMGVGCIEEKI